ncbi:hypothetical protein C8R47DRAFT_993771 [Mycena vitilis]|nr:hypothetical protein C8R47DRAFT_993771 [Mycena vitilis]
MLRANDATELCITKGQEAVVCGWHSSEGSEGQQILETLFVRLVNPPRNIQIGDLPENIVPLVRTVTHITCLLSDDTLLSVLRDQVVCLLNFGMTDYTAQGKSRKKNPVELTHCNDHRSYYVALSRGFTAEGTVIIQGFDAKKITSGMSGYLRQELRELEILDEITKMRFEGRLPPSVTGLYRRRLIRSFYAWKTDHRDPPHFHPAMRWDRSMGPRVPDAEAYSEWRPSMAPTRKRKNASVTKENEVGVLSSPERTGDKTTSAINSAAVSRRIRPAGFIWDSFDHSCGYDATFTILSNIWLEDPVRWSACFAYTSGFLGELAMLLQSAVEHRISLEDARNSVRRSMSNSKPDYFPYGPNTTSIDLIAQVILPSRYYAVGRQSCAVCGYVDQRDYGVLESYLSAGLSTRQTYPEGVQLQVWMDQYMSNGRNNCPASMATTLRDVPPMILLDLSSDRLVFSDELRFTCQGAVVSLKLRGIIYGGGHHFTCRYIEKDGEMWFHDGITTGRDCLPEIALGRVQDRLSLHRCGEKKAVAVIYARDR